MEFGFPFFFGRRQQRYALDGKGLRSRRRETIIATAFSGDQSLFSSRRRVAVHRTSNMNIFVSFFKKIV